MSVVVRMYRQGFGDCFLLTFDRADGSKYRVVIDCGVIPGQPDDAANNIRAVATDLRAETGGHVDLLIATHEHWDHISGFADAADILTSMTFDAVWMAWTEDPTDKQAQQLAKTKRTGVDALRLAEGRLRVADENETADRVAGFSSLLGAAGDKTHAAFETIRARSTNVRYCSPIDAPITLPGTSVRVYVLGPPRDEKLLRTLTGTAASGEMYGLEAPAISPDADFTPFDPIATIPIDVAREMSFFKARYFGDSAAATDDAPAWRRIDTAYLQDATQLALQLDSYTNNTSLVLAFELPDERVLLFPGDAQIGSWLSWKTLSWDVTGRTVTGPDLLARTSFYKVGHHGSHNATAEASGLETMTKLELAMIPVDHAEAVRKNWSRIPLPAIVAALNSKTHQRVIQADQSAPATVNTKSSALFHEITM